MCAAVVLLVMCCADEITVKTVDGLHELSIPMVSRQVICRFTLQTYAHTLGDFIRSILEEDKAIRHVHAENEGNLCFFLHRAKQFPPQYVLHENKILCDFHVMQVLSNV